MALKKLIFIDTNIWLDFYRAKSEAGLTLLGHVETIRDQIIVTYQLESEFKRNRQQVIIDALKELNPPQQIQPPRFLANSKYTKALKKDFENTTRRIESLKKLAKKALVDPTHHDSVYKICQRIFHGETSLVLKRDDEIRKQIRSRAWRRFLHGNPPRKKGDTSFGDAFNWEWMIVCAQKEGAELVIVSRDGDYGINFENKSYINNHLRQEFSDRVDKRRNLQLYNKLSEALREFDVTVTEPEEKEEEQIQESEFKAPTSPQDFLAIQNSLFTGFSDLKNLTQANWNNTDFSEIRKILNPYLSQKSEPPPPNKNSSDKKEEN